MNYDIKGLWLGGAISVEAAELVETAIREHALYRTHCLNEDEQAVRTELVDLANAIRAEIQRVPTKPVCDLI